MPIILLLQHSLAGLFQSAPFWALLGCLLLVAALRATSRKFRRRHRRPFYRGYSHYEDAPWFTRNPASPLVTDRQPQDEAQRLTRGLAAVNNPHVQIEPCSILNSYEAKIFYAARDLLKEKQFSTWLLFAQVSLGELFHTKPMKDEDAKEAFFAYNSRRSDLVITDNHGLPILMIEYQGGGHYQENYHLRDEIKRRVFQKAKVRSLEIPNNLLPQDIKARIKEQLDGLLAMQTVSTNANTTCV